MDELDIILGQVQGYDAVPNELKAHALEGSLIPDENDVWPSKVGYIPTYDYYYAAMNLVVYLRSQPQVTSARSSANADRSSACDASTTTDIEPTMGWRAWP